MGPIEALELALQKENESISAYQKFSVEFPVAKETFLFLLNEEEKHKKMIQDKIVELKSH